MHIRSFLWGVSAGMAISFLATQTVELPEPTRRPASQTVNDSTRGASGNPFAENRSPTCGSCHTDVVVIGIEAPEETASPWTTLPPRGRIPIPIKARSLGADAEKDVDEDEKRIDRYLLRECGFGPLARAVSHKSVACGADRLARLKESRTLTTTERLYVDRISLAFGLRPFPGP